MYSTLAQVGMAVTETLEGPTGASQPWECPVLQVCRRTGTGRIHLTTSPDRLRSSSNSRSELQHGRSIPAHELAHLLGLPHTMTGIMRSRWGRQEWTAALAGILVFSRPE